MSETTVVILSSQAKHRACSFTGETVEAAIAAAHREGLIVVKPSTEDLLTLAKEVPPGQVSATGKIVCPFVKQELYDKFASLIGTEHEVRPVATVADPLSTPAAPQPQKDLWADIAVGSIVLAEDKRESGWWEAKVLAADPDGSRLTLSWCEWPRVPPFVVLRRSVAVLAPGQ